MAAQVTIEMKISVINLERSSTRWQHMQRMFHQVGLSEYERMDAVDGRSLTHEDLLQYYDEKKNRELYFAALKTAEIACFLSHRKAWYAFLAGVEHNLCILEDDVEFVVNPEPALKMIDSVLTDSGPTMIKLFNRKAGHTNEEFSVTEFKPVSQRLIPLGTQGYCLNRDGAKRLLAFSEKFFEPVDVALQRWWDHGVKTLVLQPNLIREVSRELGGSTLRGTTNHTFPELMQRELKRPVFRLKRLMKSFGAKK